ncbi:MAG: alpha/beta hydrolase, partial [Gemmataceae bacterium]|nr:alpha/beta hydrolase [Gemmataceae bacterium]
MIRSSHGAGIILCGIRAGGACSPASPRLQSTARPLWRTLMTATLAALFLLAAPAIEADVVYGRKDGMALTMDVIKPEKPNGAGILWIPTGGWYSPWFDSKHGAAASKPLLDKGFTVFVVRHSCAPTYPIPACAADLTRAVRFIRSRAKAFGVDPERLGAWGGSAGGHLSLLLGTTGDDGDPKQKDEVLKQPSRIAAVVALYPPTDISE